MKINGLGEIVARGIFERGSFNGDNCQRIQFMGGTYPDRETEMGGLCESALAYEIEQILSKVSIKSSETLTATLAPAPDKTATTDSIGSRRP